MSIPPVLRALLTAHGPSGYETAPAAVFRDAASAYAEVTTDVMGSVWARVPGTAGGPTLAIVGHIDEIGLIVTHIDDDGFLRFIGVGGWDPQVLVGQRVSVATREGEVVGRRRAQADPPAQGRRSQEGRAPGRAAHRHRRQGRRRGARARAHRRRGGHRGRARRAAQRPRRRALDGQPPRLLRRLRGRAARPRGRRRAGRRRRGRRRAGGDELRRLARRRPTRCAPTWRSWSTSPTPPTRPASRSTSSGRTRSARARSIERGSNLNPRVVELLYETAEAEAIPFTVQASARSHRHRRRRDALLARRHPVRRHRPAAALHALAGRDGAARGRRQRGASSSPRPRSA